jgi:hypothetical protein
MIAAAYQSRSLDSTGAKRAGLVLLLFVGATLVVVGAYFCNFHLSPYTVRSPDLKTTLSCAWQILTLCLGPGAVTQGPLPELVVLGLLVATLGAADAALRGRREIRLGILGLLCFLAAIGLLAAGVAHGRGGSGSAQVVGASFRFSAVMALALCAAFCIWGSHPRPAFRQVGQVVLCVLVAALFVRNARVGMQGARSQLRLLTLFENDIRAGLPLEALAQRYQGYLYPTVGAEGIRMLHDAGIGCFRDWSDPGPGSALGTTGVVHASGPP